MRILEGDSLSENSAIKQNSEEDIKFLMLIYFLGFTLHQG